MSAKSCPLLAAAFLLILPTALLHAQPDTADANELNRMFMEKFRAGEFKEAAEIGEKLEKELPRNSAVPYNLACTYAKLGDKDKALAALDRAVDLKFENVTLFKTDEDLATLHDDPRFARLVKRLEEVVFGPADESVENAEFYFPDSLKADAPAKAVVLLHGWGGNPKDAVAKWKETADKLGFAVIAPRGSEALTEGGGSGHRWGSIPLTEAIVNKAIEAANEKHRIDKDHITIAGFSQGGMMAYIVGLNHGNQFEGIIPVAGRWVADAITPPDIAGKDMPKVFIMVGDGDRELSGSRSADETLKEWGVPHELHIYPGVGHDYPDNTTEELTKAMNYIWEK